MQRQTDQDDENFGNCNLSKSIRKVSRFKVYDAKKSILNFHSLSTIFKLFSAWASIISCFGKENGFAVISKCEIFMIKVSRKTHQTGFIISSFRLSTEVFFIKKNWELFAFSFFWFSPIKLCKAREYSAVCSWANGLCHREHDICRFSFCLGKNVRIYFSCFYEILYFS